jgi:hypothetical protein
MVEATTGPFADVSAFLASLPQAFDLDSAVGVQLDIIGQWVGRSRYITVPLQVPWFALDTVSRGFDEGIWKGPLSATTGRSPLDDDMYRALLRAVILANRWDGTVETASAPFEAFFGNIGYGVVIEDPQDMTMNVVSNATEDIIALSAMNGNVIGLKPGGVRVNYLLPSVASRPVFGFDQDNDVIAGFDIGAWAVTPSYILDGNPIYSSTVHLTDSDGAVLTEDSLYLTEAF